MLACTWRTSLHLLKVGGELSLLEEDELTCDLEKCPASSVHEEMISPGRGRTNLHLGEGSCMFCREKLSSLLWEESLSLVN